VRVKTQAIGGIDFKRDLQEITKFIEGYIDTTYLSQMHHQISRQKRECEETPSKEIQLLKAFVPFVESENKDKFSNLIEMMTYSQMIQAMLPSYNEQPLFSRGEEEQEQSGPSDYMQQAILALFLYKAILWAERYKGSHI